VAAGNSHRQVGQVGTAGQLEHMAAAWMVLHYMLLVSAGQTDHNCLQAGQTQQPAVFQLHTPDIVLVLDIPVAGIPVALGQDFEDMQMASEKDVADIVDEILQGHPASVT